MRRSRPLVPLASLATVLSVGPLMAAVALAADPVVVKPGDTLTAIARRHEVTIGDLVEWNALSDPDRIYVGQRLRVSSPTAPTAPSAPAAPVPAPASATVHTVGSGESLWTIARRYGSTVGAIAAANGITNPSRIFAGQRLTIPGSAPAARKPATRPTMPPDIAAVVAARDSVRRIIVDEAQRQGVPVAFALAVAWQESGWRQNVVSHAGAVGVMQLMPATAAWVGDTMLGSAVDSRDTRQNVRAGVRLLGHYLQRYDGDRNLALAAYYQGQWATDHHGIYAVSRPYIASITALERLFGG